MRTFYSLKTFFVMCVLCMTGTLCALAQTTVTFTNGTDYGTGTSISKGEITISVTGGTFAKGTSYYRCNKGGSMTVSSSNGVITKIVLTSTASGTAQYGPGNFQTTDGKYTYKDNVGTWDGNAESVKLSAKNNQVRMTSIEVTYIPAINVTAPTFSDATKYFSTPFDVTITAEDGADIYYTLDGTVPTISSKKYTGAINISKTTTLKAIAAKNGESSNVTSATYTYRDNISHNGTFASPLYPDEVIQRASEFNGKNVWVKGLVLGAAASTAPGYVETSNISSNIVIGEPGVDKCIAIGLYGNEKTYCNAHAADLMGKEIMFYGTVNQRKDDTGGYYGRTGILSKKVIAFAGPEEAPIATLSVNTDEGYATFVSNYAFYVPSGVVCNTIRDAEGNGVLDIYDKYKAGYNSNNIVPANYPVLVKADGKKTFNLALASGSGSSAGTNLLKAGKGEDITAEAGHHYYKLAYDDFDMKEGLGFYWGAAEGGAFYVPKGNAYLDVPSTSATSVMSFRLEDAVTGIANAEVNGQTEKVAYTIDGRRVDASHLTKGIYIVNGKKVMVK